LKSESKSKSKSRHLEDELNSSKIEVQTYINRVKELENSLSDMEDSLKNAEAAARSASDSLSQLQRQSQLDKEDKSLLSSINSNLNLKIQLLESELSKLRDSSIPAERGSLMEEYKILAHTNSVLESELEALSKELQSAKDELKSKEDKLSEYLKQSAKKQPRHSRMNSSGQDSLSGLMKSLMKETQFPIITATLSSDSDKENEEYSLKYQDLLKTIENLKAENIQLQNQLFSSNAQLKKLKIQLSQESHRVKSLQRELMEKDKEVFEEKERMSYLESYIENHSKRPTMMRSFTPMVGMLSSRNESFTSSPEKEPRSQTPDMLSTATYLPRFSSDPFSMPLKLKDI
jgi:DNA repair exonuclease SbcCD ATPase subunit